MGFISSYEVNFEHYCEKCTEFCYKFYNKEKCKNCMKIRRRFDTNVPIYFEERKTEEEMTDYGYDYILEQIAQSTVAPPSAEDYNLVEFNAWTEGYKACYDHIIGLIIGIKEANSQGR